MEMVIISCTNRKNSFTLKVSRIYEKILLTKGVKVKFLDFTILPENITASETFGNRTENYNKLISEFISGNKRFVFVIPEYNGSYPGILKTFLDSVHPSYWTNKKACLVGVSDGRAGNLRGMEHLTGVLQYLKMHVYYNKLPISQISKLIDVEGNFSGVEQLKVCEMQVEGFLNF